jgi:hypothetical protein
MIESVYSQTPLVFILCYGHILESYITLLLANLYERWSGVGVVEGAIPPPLGQSG